MSARANPTRIGAFVIGAVVLTIVVVMVFGSGDLFTKKEHYVVFFSDSVNGLTVGAPVKMRGVKMGEVKVIRAFFDHEGQVYIEVIVQTIVDVVEATGTLLEGATQKEAIEHLIDKQGLRAQLALQSLVLGQLYINIDYFPDTEAVYRHLNDDYYEVPSIPQSGAISGDIARLVDTIVDLPLEQTVLRLNSVLARADTALTGVDVAGLFHEVELTLAEMKKLTEMLDRHLEPTTESLIRTSESARITMEKADSLFTQLTQITGEREDEVALTMQELRAAARALAELSDYLQRHPSSLIWGKD